ncbi:15 kDa selenoprotein [Exaiptasia diaphana]|nr:15 kDa selenoprotein [Exaiptasia diaphana]
MDQQFVDNCRSCCHEEGESQAASKFVRGADPILKLHSEDGSVQEELSIEKWNTDSVEEFLTEKLQVS